MINDQPILHLRGRPICYSHRQSLTTLRSEIPRPRFNGNRCLPPALGSVDSIHTCPNRSTSTHSPEDTARSSNRIGDRSNLGGTTLISRPTGVSGLSRRNNLPPFDPQAIHPMWRTLRLGVWPLSGHAYKQQAFHERCAKFCWPLGEQAPKRDTKDLGKCELAGACRGVNVPFQPL